MMSDVKNRDELLKDLQLIKEAVKRNSSIFKYIPIAQSIKNVALFTGIAIIACSFLLLWINDFYGSYSEIPAVIKIVLYIAVGLSFAGLAYYKIRSILQYLRRYKKDVNLEMLLNEVYTKTFYMSITPLVLTLAVFCVYLPTAGLSHLIIPVVSIIIALMLTTMMVTMNLKEFLLCGEWLFLSGSFSLFISGMASPYVLLILTFGIGMLILYFSILLSSSKEKRDKVG